MASWYHSPQGNHTHSQAVDGTMLYLLGQETEQEELQWCVRVPHGNWSALHIPFLCDSGRSLSLPCREQIQQWGWPGTVGGHTHFRQRQKSIHEPETGKDIHTQDDKCSTDGVGSLSFNKEVFLVS